MASSENDIYLSLIDINNENFQINFATFIKRTKKNTELMYDNILVEDFTDQIWGM